ncbi:hypothetical protein L195_g048842 [Trifolium pratense]|uniref:Reverse transcriptase zinc-binding domain-containing protein n=1 Tax=Trifolium pratense TaxID=57577 RepID=A0A2K3JMF2_TRIPR|nr:hypothetical protein L195_g048842 [Trifolium pratense]
MAAVQELMLLLQQIRPCVDSLDRRKWSSGTAGLFTVKSAYICLQNKYGMAEIELAKVQALQQLWLNNVPPKVNIFGWRLLLEKLPTREALYLSSHKYGKTYSNGWAQASLLMKVLRNTSAYLGN